MSKIDYKLSAIQNQVLSQMIVQPDISENFSSNLKKTMLKVGLVSVMAIASLASTAAHADDNNALRAVLGVSAVSGLLTNNSRAEGVPAECNVQGVSGITVGGSAAAGGYVGSRFGNGTGKTAWTLGLATLAGGAAYTKETNRIEQAKADCVRRLQQNQSNQNRNNGYVNNNYTTPGLVANPQSPTSLILYTFQSYKTPGQTALVTMDNSPGVNALRGIRDGARDPASDPVVLNGIEQAIHGLEVSYNNFQANSDSYIQIANGSSSSTKSARYAVNDYDGRVGERDLSANKQAMQQAVKNWDASFNSYARERAFAAAILDNAAIDGYRISQYAHVLTLLQPPPTATVACQCSLPNRSSSVPSRLTSDR